MKIVNMNDDFIGYKGSYNNIPICFHANIKIVKYYMEEVRKLDKDEYDIEKVYRREFNSSDFLDNMIEFNHDCLLTLLDWKMIERDWIHFTPKMSDAVEVLLTLARNYNREKKNKYDIKGLVNSAKIIKDIHDNNMQDLYDKFCENHPVNGLMDIDTYIDEYIGITEGQYLYNQYYEKVHFDENDMRIDTEGTDDLPF